MEYHGVIESMTHKKYRAEKERESICECVYVFMCACVCVCVCMYVYERGSNRKNAHLQNT